MEYLAYKREHFLSLKNAHYLHIAISEATGKSKTTLITPYKPL